jgi:hypothetical protein
VSDERKQTTAEQACFHIVRRVTSDPGFAWSMFATESLALAIKACAEFRGEPNDTALREEVEKNAACLRYKPEIVELREEVEKLREAMIDKPQLALKDNVSEQMFDAIAAVERLVQLAEWGHAVLTVENLKEALEGNRVC